jgi:hypothetical protein
MPRIGFYRWDLNTEEIRALRYTPGAKKGEPWLTVYLDSGHALELDEAEMECLLEYLREHDLWKSEAIDGRDTKS